MEITMYSEHTIPVIHLIVTYSFLTHLCIHANIIHKVITYHSRPNARQSLVPNKQFMYMYFRIHFYLILEKQYLLHVCSSMETFLSSSLHPLRIHQRQHCQDSVSIVIQYYMKSWFNTYWIVTFYSWFYTSFWEFAT